MGSRRSRYTILLALMVATAAAYAAFLAVNGSADDPGGDGAALAAPPTIEQATVLVAKQDIPAGMTVTIEMVEIRQVALDAVSPRALTQPEQAVGLLTAVALTAGEQILDTRLTTQPLAPDTFAYEVPEGLRALSLIFTEIQGFGAMVQPGDHVDVVAYFEIDVKDVTIDNSITIEEDPDADEAGADEADEAESPDAADEADEAESPDAADEADEAESPDAADEADGTDEADDGAEDEELVVRVEINQEEDDEIEYTQYVSVYVVQNVEVLAVAQALSPEQVGIADRRQAANEDENAEAAALTEPQARPEAISVTLAVTPEAAQRLMLAVHLAVNQTSGVRLLVRAPGDTTIYDLPPAQLGEIPLGGLLGDINVPMTPTELVITEVEFTTQVVNSGDVLEFRATVKNVSDRTIPAGGVAPPEYVYTQGVGYDDLGFFGEIGGYRIGLNVAGATPITFPYRWGLGRDLAPGESTTIVGAVQLTEPVPDARYWLGVIQEPNVVTQDGVAVTEVTVLEARVVTVDLPSAQLLAAPDPTAAIVQALAMGDRLTVLAARGPWYQVRSGDAEGWIAAGAIAPLIPTDTVTSDAEVSGALRDQLGLWR